jgi:hypothetical protein
METSGQVLASERRLWYPLDRWPGEPPSRSGQDQDETNGLQQGIFLRLLGYYPHKVEAPKNEVRFHSHGSLCVCGDSARLHYDNQHCNWLTVNTVHIHIPPYTYQNNITYKPLVIQTLIKCNAGHNNHVTTQCNKVILLSMVSSLPLDGLPALTQHKTLSELRKISTCQVL